MPPAAMAPPQPPSAGDPFYDNLWDACAGLLVTVPRVGDLIFYFPQWHIEQGDGFQGERCSPPELLDSSRGEVARRCVSWRRWIRCSTPSRASPPEPGRRQVLLRPGPHAMRGASARVLLLALRRERPRHCQAAQEGDRPVWCARARHQLTSIVGIRYSMFRRRLRVVSARVKSCYYRIRVVVDWEVSVGRNAFRC